MALFDRAGVHDAGNREMGQVIHEIATRLWETERTGQDQGHWMRIPGIVRGERPARIKVPSFKTEHSDESITGSAIGRKATRHRVRRPIQASGYGTRTCLATVVKGSRMRLTDVVRIQNSHPDPNGFDRIGHDGQTCGI